MFEVVIISTTEPISMRGLLSLRVDGDTHFMEHTE